MVEVVGENVNKLAVHYSSLTDKWNTPLSIYRQLDSEFHFDFDPCPANFCPETLFYKPGSDETARDGLLCEWGYRNFVNPPYSEIERWIRKGYQEYKKGKTVVFLIPSRTDTSYWHDYIMKATEIRFIRGRLKFGKAKNSAPFPSAIVIFKQETQLVLWEVRA
jgi:phage N-6-adenine-methyltransferase